MNHPIQPVERDKHGTLRFKPNAIIDFLFRTGKIDLNMIAIMPFEVEDREQLLQLLGHSLGSFADYDYVRDETYETAKRMGEGETEEQARIAYLEEELAALKTALRSPMARLFGVSSEDLN